MELKDVLEIKEKVKEYVNNSDPWYLIEGGAPVDEYNSQIDRIVSVLVTKKLGPPGLEAVLFEIFKTNEHELDRSRILELSNKLLTI